MDTFVTAIAGTGIGVVLGGVITFLCSRCFYMKAARDLSVFARGPEEAGCVQYIRDQSENLIGVVRRGKASLVAEAILEAGGDVMPREP